MITSAAASASVSFVNIQSVVHDRVRLRVVDVDVVQIGEVLLFSVVHDVDGEVLGGLDGSLLLREDVALLGFVVLRGLLCGGRPIGVVYISFSRLAFSSVSSAPDLWSARPVGRGSGSGIRRARRRRRRHPDEQQSRP